MRLPPQESLVEPDHLFLYEHDCAELHNPDPRDFRRLNYSCRFDALVKAVEEYVSAGLVLDVGCAQGNFALALAERGYQVVAMDLRPSFLRYLRMKHEGGVVNCVTASITAFPFRPRTFDVVILGELLEHVAYPESLLREAGTLLKPGGLLLATTPNGDRLHTGLPTLSEIVDRKQLESRQFRPDADGHLFLLTRRELLCAAEDAQLRVLQHRWFGTPWITGRLMGRYVAKVLPLRLLRRLDTLTLVVPGLSRHLADGQMLVGQAPERAAQAD